MMDEKIQKELWQETINSEGLNFHEKNINENRERLVRFWSAECPVRSIIIENIQHINKPKIKLLDVGCGPFPKSGKVCKGFDIERVLVDALAEEYHRFLSEQGIQPEEVILKCNAEELDELFVESSFDVIFSKNALDHTYNPMRAIKKMYSLLNENGVIILEHYRNEGKYTNYAGLHQWDFDIVNDEFIISNKQGNAIFLRTIVNGECDIHLKQNGDIVIVMIMKLHTP